VPVVLSVYFYGYQVEGKYTEFEDISCVSPL
jgi:hypothetical protein